MAVLTRAVPLALLACALTAGPAGAAVQHEVVTANSPSTGKPVIGGGTWLVNKPSGYYVGRAMPGSRFDNVFTSPKGWHYGRASGPNMCTWAMPGSLGRITGHPQDSCSDTTRAYLSHRMNIGKDYNAPAHEATDGTSVPAGQCSLFYNYFHGTNFATNGGHWANYAGQTARGVVMYRFTTLDGRAAVVRDADLGWGFVDATCVGRPAQVHNDND